MRLRPLYLAVEYNQSQVLNWTFAHEFRMISAQIQETDVNQTIGGLFECGRLEFMC